MDRKSKTEFVAGSFSVWPSANGGVILQKMLGPGLHPVEHASLAFSTPAEMLAWLKSAYAPNDEDLAVC